MNPVARNPKSEKMWRFGKLLVCLRDVYFPDRCVKSNDPVGSRA